MQRTTPDGSSEAAAGAAWPDQALLDEVVRRVVEVAQPERIILFGSAARGQASPESDLDLLVIKRDVSHRGRLAEKIHLNFFGLGVAVDVIVATPEDILEVVRIAERAVRWAESVIPAP